MTNVLRIAVFFAFFIGIGLTAEVDERLYKPGTGDEVIDSGEFVITREDSIIRREAFEVIRHADGGRTIVSVVTPEDASYRFEGRWDYDEEERATSARGIGTQIDRTFEASITAKPTDATMTITYAPDQSESHKGPCSPECLIDMSPGSLAQFTLSRRYDFSKVGIQEFRWVGFSPIDQQRSFDIIVQIDHVRDLDVELADGSTLKVRHFVFDEELTLEDTGERLGLRSSIWVDDAHRPIKYKAGERTVGIRVGFEDIDDKLVLN